MEADHENSLTLLKTAFSLHLLNAYPAASSALDFGFCRSEHWTAGRGNFPVECILSPEFGILSNVDPDASVYMLKFLFSHD